MIKQTIEEIRDLFMTVSEKIESLENKEVELSLVVGTNQKTITFDKLTVLSLDLKATVKQEL